MTELKWSPWEIREVKPAVNNEHGKEDAEVELVLSPESVWAQPLEWAKPFDVMLDSNQLRLAGLKKKPTIPWCMLDEQHAQRIHTQSLQRLNERGGLSPTEILLNINRAELSTIKTWYIRDGDDRDAYNQHVVEKWREVQQLPPPTVQITSDLFAGDGLEVVDEQGRRMFKRETHWHPIADGREPEDRAFGPLSEPLTSADLRNRALSIIEKCQHLRFEAKASCPKCWGDIDWRYKGKPPATWGEMFCDCGWASQPFHFPPNLTLTQQEEPSRG